MLALCTQRGLQLAVFLFMDASGALQLAVALQQVPHLALASVLQTHQQQGDTADAQQRDFDSFHVTLPWVVAVCR